MNKTFQLKYVMIWLILPLIIILFLSNIVEAKSFNKNDTQGIQCSKITERLNDNVVKCKLSQDSPPKQKVENADEADEVEITVINLLINFFLIISGLVVFSWVPLTLKN